MNNSKSDYKLSKFFIQQGLKKSAVSMGNFSDVNSDEDMSKYAGLVADLLKLPQYQQIIDALKRANGIVNFVTNDEFAPLSELLIKQAFPPSGNDIYHMGEPALISEDYFVSARHYFGNSIQTDANNFEASQRFENLIHGSPKLRDEQWMRDNNITKPELDAVYGKITINDPAHPGQTTQVGIVDIMRMYKDMMRALETGTIKRSIDAIVRQLQQDEDTKRNVKFLKRFSSQIEAAAVSPKGEPVKANPETLKQIGRLIDKMKMVLENMGSNPEFRNQTTDVIEARNALLSFLGDNNTAAANNVINGVGVFKRIINDLTNQKSLSDADVISLRKQLKSKRGLFAQQKEKIHNVPLFEILKFNDSFSKTPIRSQDGFMNWDPIGDIRRVVEALALAKDKPAIDGAIENLKVKLREYRTTDPKLIEIKNDILSFFGGDSERNIWMLSENTATYMRLIRSFLERAGRHGKVMIFTDVENSVLCAKNDNPDESGHFLSSSTLESFSEVNQSNKARDRSTGKPERGHRTIILITARPLNNLPDATVIEMGNFRVDQEDAEIIIDHLLRPYVKAAKDIKVLGLIETVENEFNNKEGSKNKIAQEKRSRMAQIGNIMTGLSRSFGRMPMEAEEQMAQMIIGMTVRRAIKSVESSLEAGIVYEYDDDGSVSSMQMNAKTAIKKMADEVNEGAMKDVIGIEIREPMVEFEKYAYKKISKWGSVVGRVGHVAEELIRIREDIRINEERIARIEAELTNGIFDRNTNTFKSLTADEIRDRQKLKGGLENELKALEIDRITTSTRIPHMTVLYGSPGVGKSVWADALAWIMGIDHPMMIRDVDLSAQRDKWVGNTPKNTKRLIESMKHSRNTVYLIDEIDRQMAMEHGSQGQGTGGSAHETTKGMVTQFLNLFEQDKPIFVKHNVFFVITTNHIEGVDTALLDRADVGVAVEAPDTPEDYEKFLESFIAVEYRKDPENPWFSSGTETEKLEAWNSTFELINQLDLKQLANIFVSKQLSFRQVKGIMKDAIVQHGMWMIYQRTLQRGINSAPDGLPLTTQNLIGCASRAQSASNANADRDNGVDDYAAIRRAELEDLIRNRELEEIEVTNPHTGEVTKGLKLPEDAIEFMQGEGQEEDVEPQYTVIEEDVEDPDRPGERRKRVSVQPLSPEDQMKKLVEDGIEEVPVVEEQEIVTPVKTPRQSPENNTVEKENEEDIEKEENITSSTDYLFKYLQKQGVIGDNGGLMNEIEQGVAETQADPEQKAIKEQQGGQPETEEAGDQPLTLEDYERRGVYQFDQVLIAPATPETPPQFLSNSNTIQKG